MTEVRYAVPSDLPALTDIYNHYVVNTRGDFRHRAVRRRGAAEWFDHYGARTAPVAGGDP